MTEHEVILSIARDWGLWGAALAFAGVVFWRLIWPEVVKTRDFNREQEAQDKDFKQDMRKLQLEFYNQAIMLMQGVRADLVSIRLAIESAGCENEEMPDKTW